jgi:hypothetical protein
MSREFAVGSAFPRNRSTSGSGDMTSTGMPAYAIDHGRRSDRLEQRLAFL